MATLKRARAFSNPYEDGPFCIPATIDFTVATGTFAQPAARFFEDQWNPTNFMCDTQPIQVHPIVERAIKRCRLASSTMSRPIFDLALVKPIQNTPAPIQQSEDQMMDVESNTMTQDSSCLSVSRPAIERHDSFIMDQTALDFKAHVAQCWYLLRGRYRQYPRLHNVASLPEIWETLLTALKDIVHLSTQPFTPYPTKRNALIALTRIGKDICWMDHGALRQSLRQSLLTSPILEEAMYAITQALSIDEKRRLFVNEENDGNWIKVMYRLAEMNRAENMFNEERVWDVLRNVDGLFWSRAVAEAQLDTREPGIWVRTPEWPVGV